ncbi:hypothetical protein PYW07_012730 [Mythimna separata]|uniref:C2H2-type domain-containing protein n=1 Tax=Mythimna separata TaxID=271217 RepID=A0AAD7Y960_MYTSE|nr:hypothetical protein PYW07_012730 [Mythimna separata]
MAEPDTSELSSTVFIDVASASQYPIVECAETEPVKMEQDNRATSPLEAFLSPQPRRIRCPECKRYTAETEEKMLRHIRKMHRGENPFQCFMCDYSTYNKVLFEEHVRIHQGIKPYKCSHCSYRSVSKKNTKKHELIHRPDNPHKCDQCGFIARHARALKHHELSHGKEVVKECSVCKETFGSVKSYTGHRKNRKRCPECQKMFCGNIYDQHRMEIHGVKKKERRQPSKKCLFTCGICKWEGNSKPRILLHLIHHPEQAVDESVVDTLILRELGIMPERSAS